MATGSLAHIVPRLRAAVLAPRAAGDDAELLDRFVAHRDDIAFETLVRRHGPMVLAVCRRVLRHAHDAEDAFQATFLVLAHKARTVSPREKLAGWLHGVAYKTALKARERAARRTDIETRAPPRTSDEMRPDIDRDEVGSVLDQELSGLPAHYRLPIVMCDLEDRLRTEVAAALGCSEGTLSARLTRGRRMLAERLTRRGVHLSAVAVAALLADRSAVAEPLIRAAAGTCGALGSAAAAPAVAELASGVLRGMFLAKLRTASLAAFTLLALSLSGAADTGAAPAPPDAGTPPALKGGRKGAVPDPLVDTRIDDLADADGRLLMNRKVLKDIGCDIGQLDRILDALEDGDRKARQKTADLVAGGTAELRREWRDVRRTDPRQAPGPDAQAELLAKLGQAARRAGAEEFAAAVAAVVRDVLTAAQRKRFRQIDLQARGCDALTTPAVVAALGITADQKDRLDQNARQVGEDIALALRPPAKPSDRETAIRDGRAQGMVWALALLSDEQKAAWTALVGTPFQHPLPLPNGPFGGTAP
jgi:RNA polymerase sigma factor (sigma-70 family)